MGAALLSFARRHGNRDVDRVACIQLNATCDRVAIWRVGITRLDQDVFMRRFGVLVRWSALRV